MSGGGGSRNQTTRQIVDVPAFLRPFVQSEAQIRGGALDRLSGQLRGAGAQHLVEPFTAEEQEAFDLLAARGRGAGGFLPTTEDALLGTARGQLSPVTSEARDALSDFTERDPLQDPAIREATTAAVRSVLPEISSLFARSGRSGSGLERAAIGQATADALTSQLGAERGRRLSAAGGLASLGGQIDARRLAAAQALPGVAQLGPGLLLSAGEPQRTQGQLQREAPILAQERLLAAASGTPFQSLFGQTGTQEIPLHRNRAAGAAGGAISGAVAGSTLGPVGTVGGGLLGLLGGLFA